MMKKIRYLLLCLVFFSLACMSMAGAARLDAESPAGTATTLTNAAPALTATLAPTLALDLSGERCAVVIASESLHLRGGASENDIVLTWLDRDDVVQLVSDSDPNWWRVRFESFEGWARSIYLQESECVK